MRTSTLRHAARALLAGLVALWASAVCQADTVLITGANSGIGLEFTRQYAAKGWTVIATHRHDSTPDSLLEVMKKFQNVRAERMDVTSEAEVHALAQKLQGVPIDVLINNAGVYNDNGDWSTQNFGRLKYPLGEQILAVNVLGPLLVSESFVSQVKASKQRKIVSISSTNGSITQPLAGTGAIFYRASKAGLNRAMLLVANVLKPDGITVALLHPGAVRTERQANLKYPDMVETPFTVTNMIKTIDGLTLEDTGRFMRYDGVTVPW